jgi:hypothetical protein
MKLIKKFEDFVYGNGASQPAPSPKEAPTIAPGQPKTRPSKPSPIRRDRPAVDPAPKAGKDDKSDMLKATEEDVIQKFATLTDQKYK